MGDKSSSIQRKSLHPYWAIAVVVIVVAGIYQGLAYRQEMILRECCAPHTRRFVPKILIRNQQLVFFRQGKFASSIEELELFTNYRIHPELKKMYDYSIENHPNRSIIRVLAKQPGYRSYIGQVTVIPNAKPNDAQTEGILCEAEKPGIRVIDPSIDAKNCAKGTIKID
jgi:Type IV pilin-like G and H, putative